MALLPTPHPPPRSPPRPLRFTCSPVRSAPAVLARAALARPSPAHSCAGAHAWWRASAFLLLRGVHPSLVASPHPPPVHPSTRTPHSSCVAHASGLCTCLFHPVVASKASPVPAIPARRTPSTTQYSIRLPPPVHHPVRRSACLWSPLASVICTPRSTFFRRHPVSGVTTFMLVCPGRSPGPPPCVAHASGLFAGLFHPVVASKLQGIRTRARARACGCVASHVAA